MIESPLKTFRSLLNLRFLATVAVVVAVVAPLGVAMTGRFGLGWVTSGAIIWTVLFGYAASRTGRSQVAWGLAGGLICSTIWAQGEIIGDKLVFLGLGTWTTLAVLSISAGLGGGALVGSTFGEGASLQSERNLKVAALLMGAGLGFSGGLVVSVVNDSPSLMLKAAFLLIGALVGCATAIPGRALGLWFRPAVLFFDQLWPYLREMGIPLAAFAVGYFCLTVAFGGFYGALWHSNPRAFDGLPPVPRFWDFVYFSLLTASTANTVIVARSQGAQLLVAIEVILGLGWLIVVFGALSAHLAPRLEAIAKALHDRADSSQ
jgi:hypothetical protein